MSLLHVSSASQAEGIDVANPWQGVDAEQDTLEVEVLTIQERSIGLVVDHILDINEPEHFRVRDRQF